MGSKYMIAVWQMVKIEQQGKGEREHTWDGTSCYPKMVRDTVTDKVSLKQVSWVGIWGEKIISDQEK